MLNVIEIYTEALTSGHIDRAVGIAKCMTSSARMVAREIWSTWKNMSTGKNLTACPF